MSEPGTPNLIWAIGLWAACDFYEENNSTDAPFAESPYLWQSKLIEVTPRGTSKYGEPSYFFRKGTTKPPKHISIWTGTDFFLQI